ncbi:Npun_F0296 family exosortase-dependent surface protein [Microcoleus sp. OTE_8_concoct_300]|uniref:Npun_F0296 family exosortase-dependent surface protein n=1 Tax=Microcoleus sp. OTE_8_concoct_300 TaxID=2964710 RepID=UPI00403F0F46
MTSINKLSVLIIGAAVFTVISDPADAITLTFGGTPVAGQGQFSNVPGVTTIDFESGAPTSGLAIYSAPGPGPAVVSGNTVSSIISLDDNSRYLAVSVLGDARGTSPVTIAFANPLDYFGLYWGTPSANNTIGFFNGNTLVQSFSGNAIDSSVITNGGVYANFFAQPGEFFNKVVLSDSSIAFESDNHAYKVGASESVPEPVTSLTAFASVVGGVLMKRQQQRKVVDRSDR